MLRLITGPAGSGKTAAVMQEIKQNMLRGEKGSILIVPEQYSHEAERELCRVCGDALSLYAEVMSFTGLARHVARKQGGAAAPWLDKGGRLLCMALALKNTASRLKIYSSADRKAEMQAMLLAAVDELKTACISSEALLQTAAELDDGLGDKLSDLASLIATEDIILDKFVANAEHLCCACAVGHILMTLNELYILSSDRGRLQVYVYHAYSIFIDQNICPDGVMAWQ